MAVQCQRMTRLVALVITYICNWCLGNRVSPASCPSLPPGQLPAQHLLFILGGVCSSAPTSSLCWQHLNRTTAKIIARRSLRIQWKNFGIESRTGWLAGWRANGMDERSRTINQGEAVKSKNKTKNDEQTRHNGIREWKRWRQPPSSSDKS